MACGIALTIIAELETSPISSFPYVLSLMSSFTVGTGTIAMNAGFMVLQMLLLRKHYDPGSSYSYPPLSSWDCFATSSSTSFADSAIPPISASGSTAPWELSL